MLDLKFLRGNMDLVRQALANRNSSLSLDHFEELDRKRRELLLESETLKSERNKASGEVARLKREGQDAQSLLGELSAKSERIKILDDLLKGVDDEVQGFLLTIPNIPHASVPVGKSEEDNQVVRTWGEPKTFDFTPKEHWELGTALGGLDFERAAKLAGSRFVVLRGWAARLERALAAFMLDVQTCEHGYTEIVPPYMVNRQTMTGTGQLPKFEEDLFKLEGCDYYLIPTAEVPLTNLHADETLDEDKLPLTFCAFTPCFRSEAGSYGKDTKGLVRLHQFHKVELVRIAHPDRSYEDLELMTSHAETILQKLGLPYRVLALCTGDMGFSATKTYDLEVWLPGQGKYREISSCSNCEDFQARRAGIRCKEKSAKKSRLTHTLNGSGLAVGRTMVAVLENYQQADGSILVPEALKSYMGGLDIIRPEV
ncbi:serine--tRNA ligase [Desulfocurvibacter africanus]|uniref:Serine--tRNA ligase n=1 Tax=Desulfocurvibacter africanus subsp. africanus str. Walvis Bay TaxID=690850 RepID=F3Z343_DESAF|nr:serine--tRNA ligase [Desulfocurvibacter africanus]EGJ50287.1 Seryl-tRNA synthetase [Desulfocurvibacter africanus subsp. africanus str. Walvis Bay]